MAADKRTGPGGATPQARPNVKATRTAPDALTVALGADGGG